MSVREHVIEGLAERFPDDRRRFLDSEARHPLFRYLLLGRESVAGEFTGRRRLSLCSSLDDAIERAETLEHLPEAVIDLDAEGLDSVWIVLRIEEGGSVSLDERQRAFSALLAEIDGDRIDMPADDRLEMELWIDRFTEALRRGAVGPLDF